MEITATILSSSKYIILCNIHINWLSQICKKHKNKHFNIFFERFYEFKYHGSLMQV